MPPGEPEPRRPNLFLAGAPKCGTTALSQALAGHPQVYMSERAELKEPNFFNSDEALHWPRCESMEEYLGLFSAAPAACRYRGEASVLYLYSEVAIPRLFAFNPEAKIICMLRNPLEMIAALFNQHVRANAENVGSLERAWRLQSARRRGKALPPGWRSARLLQYGAVCRVGEQISRLLEVFPREQVHILLHEDFLADPRKSWLELLDFLDLTDDLRRGFPTANPSIHYRSGGAQNLINSLRRARNRLGIPGGWGLNSWLVRVNRTRRKKPALSPAFRAELTAWFTPDVARLESVLDRDLSHWLR